jgi:F0F1-type ATP synthase assembly protein I
MPIYTFAVLFLTTLEFELRNNLKTRKETNRELMQYAGMGAQFLVSIGVGIFIGLKLDQWINFSFPLLVWLLPLLIIIGLIIKIVKDTSKK